MRRTAVLWAWAVLGALPTTAADRWEIRGDNGSYTNNELQPGVVQEGHDLESTPKGPDVDWYKLRALGLRSYEARVFGGGVVWKYASCADCATFDRVAPDGSVIAAGDFETTLQATGLSVRWLASGGDYQWLRVTPGKRGAGGFPSEKYDILVVDTTLFLPRFNNIGTQRTLVMIQNTRAQPIMGQITFHEASGAVIDGIGFTLLPYGSQVVDTSAYAPLQGKAGSAILAHTAGRSGLVAKAVAIDPVTGFTFDTPLTGVDP